MRILIAEDDPISRRVLETTLKRWGYDVVVAVNGNEAWDLLQDDVSPQLAILDWMMPGLDGIQLCRRLRETATIDPVYILLLTARGEKEDIVTGLEAGANDYVTKPFDREELQARVRVGARMVELQQSLADRVSELEEALQQVKRLEGILPICSFCKRVRDDADYWQQVESYVASRSEARFSHGICPECWESRVRPELEQLAACSHAG